MRLLEVKAVFSHRGTFSAWVGLVFVLDSAGVVVSQGWWSPFDDAVDDAVDDTVDDTVDDLEPIGGVRWGS